MRPLIKYILIFLLILQSCNTEKPVQDSNKIKLSGNITGLADTSLQFIYDSYKLLDSRNTVDFELDSSGYFSLELDSNCPLKGFISFGKTPKTYKFVVTLVNGQDSSMQVESVDFRMIYFYLSPGDNLQMSVNADDIKNSLSFKGTGAGNNLFVNHEEWEFNRYKNKYLNNYYYLTYFEADDFKIRKEEIRKEKKTYLLRFQKDYTLSEHLVKLYDNQYDQDKISSLIYYPAGHAGFNDGVKPVLPDNYFDFIDKAEIPEDIDDMGIGAYFYLNSLLKKQYELSAGNNSELSFYDFVDETLNERLAYVFKAYALNRDFNKELFDLFDESCPYPDIAKLVVKKYGHLEGMLAGNPFPDFKLETTDGEIITPDDLKGNYVYIDFWATWCKPCVKEIPHLEKIQEEFKDKPISFVSISIDREKDMKGLQLWANEEHHDIFSKSLNIKSIPRFVLLDKEGKIIEAKALRPSDQKLKEVLKIILE